jgi:hypothetical protein
VSSNCNVISLCSPDRVCEFSIYSHLFNKGYDTLLEGSIGSVAQELENRRGVRSAQVQLQVHKMALVALESSEKYIRKVPAEIVTSADFNLLRVTCEEMAETRFLLQKCNKTKLLIQMESVSSL